MPLTTLKNTSTETVSPEEQISNKLFQFSLSNLQILNGHADILDKQMDENHNLREFNLSIPFMSNIGDLVRVFAEPHFSLNFNDSQISSSGKTIPFDDSRNTSIGFSVKGLDISKYFEYVPLKSNLIISSGNVNANVIITFIHTKNKRNELSISGNIELSQLIASDTLNNPLLATVHNLSVDDFNIHCKDIVDDQTDDILLNEISIKCENISTIENSKTKLDFSCKINGEACIFPASANMDLNVNALNLRLFQPFINDIIGDKLDRKVKYQKYILLVNKGRDVATVDEINIGPDEYDKYLKKAFKAKEINVKISSKDENYLSQMETSIKDRIKITEADLRLLAKNRTQSIKTYILESGKVKAERLFLIEPKKLNPNKKNKLKDSRVELILK